MVGDLKGSVRQTCDRAASISARGPNIKLGRQSVRSDAPEDHRRTRDALVVLLAVNSGATDAIGFLALGGAFTSVMTGNMVLLGLSAGTANGVLAGHIAAAMICYIAGCALGGRVAGSAKADDPVWPPAITRALAVETAVFAIYAVSWWGSGSHPRGWMQLALLGVNAVALGIQSASVQRFGVSGLSTTYLTGTLTTMVVRLVSGRPARELLHSAQILCGLVGGAALGALCVVHAAALTPLLQLGSLGLVLVGVAIRSRDRNPQPSSIHPTRVVVVGMGRLGKALVRRIPTEFEVVGLSRTVHDPAPFDRPTLVVTDDLSVVDSSGVILLAVPPDAIPETLERLAPHLGTTALVVNMATEAATPQMRRYAPTARLISAKIIGQAGEIAAGSPAVIVVDFATAEELTVITEVLRGLGSVIVAPEQLVLDVNSAVAEEIVAAEHAVRVRLQRLEVPGPAITTALTTMAVGILRAVATDSCGPFLKRFVDAHAAAASSSPKAAPSTD